MPHACDVPCGERDAVPARSHRTWQPLVFHATQNELKRLVVCGADAMLRMRVCSCTLCGGPKTTQDPRREHGENRPQDPQFISCGNMWPFSKASGDWQKYVYPLSYPEKRGIWSIFWKSSPEQSNLHVPLGRQMHRTSNCRIPVARGQSRFPSANSAGWIRGPPSTWKTE